MNSSTVRTRKWETIHKGKSDDIVTVLLANRGLTAKKEVEEFLHPKLEDVTIKNVGIDKKQVAKALARIKKAIEKQEQIIVYGDYDVDGICGSAVLWESLHALGAKVMPYIPHRIDEGYGLSVNGINNVILNVVKDLKGGLIITVDNGIVANDAVDFANKQGIDVIITDHHTPPAGGSKKLPKAYAIVHTTKLCGTGVAWMLTQELQQNNDHLELVALATVADLVPLLKANRTLTKFGIEKLRNTKRVGLLALFDEVKLERVNVGTYEIGHMIAPRLNAMGRLESAMDSLRLLCTKDKVRAKDLAQKLQSTNKQRQLITEEAVLHAKTTVRNGKLEVKKLLFIAHESYQQGVIGLVAGKLVEEFYRPSIVLSIGEKYSKASARSIHGFNMIEFIRNASEFLVDAGGHPMAAGFTIETDKIVHLQKKLESLVEGLLDEDGLTRMLKIDCEIDFAHITQSFYEKILALEPFGMQNFEPVFVSRNIAIENIRTVGADGKHLKLKVNSEKFQVAFDAIAFGIGEKSAEFKAGDKVDIVYSIDENTWNGNTKLQLRVRDIKATHS